MATNNNLLKTYYDRENRNNRFLIFNRIIHKKYAHNIREHKS